eukprot:Nk52_evm33s554 gene=Nk52_evmTU33s554
MKISLSRWLFRLFLRIWGFFARLFRSAQPQYRTHFTSSNSLFSGNNYQATSPQSSSPLADRRVLQGAAGSRNHSHGQPQPHYKKKILVLDLDETLIHSSVKDVNVQYDLKIEIFINRMACLFYVYKRPYVDFFLETVQQWYNLVIFTASIKEYGCPVIDSLDAGKGLFQRRYYRESCIHEGGSFIKDLKLIDPDLRNIMIIDNSPAAYAFQQENAIPIESWMDNPNDEALLDLLPFLDALRFSEDVRSVLSLRLR